MASHRRYRWEVYLQYDQVYEAALKNSEILSGIGDYHNVTLWNKQSLGWKRQELIGDKKGLHDGLPALIPALQTRIKELIKNFELYQKQCRNEGKVVPVTPLPEQAKELYMAEALVDIHLEELDKIEKMIADFVEEEVKIVNTNMLRQGPKGISTLKGGVIVEADGQKVTMSEDGFPYIDQEGSPFNGLGTADYFTKVVRPWRIACAKAATETENKIANKELDASKVSQGKLRGTNVPWPELPPNCKNFKKSEIKKVGLVRTK
jgi:hypothetical protein